MADSRRALGRGLDSLLPPSAPVAEPARMAEAKPPAAMQIPVAAIDRNPFQTRLRIDATAIEELTQSIALHGVLQPVLVRPIANDRYQLIAGERRWLASQAAGKETIPAVVRAVPDTQALEWTIIENLQREDLDPIEQGRAFARLHDEFQLNHEEIAKRTGKDRSSITNFIRLLRLPAEVQKMVAERELSMGHAKLLLGLDPEAITPVARRVAEGGLSVRKTEEIIQAVLRPQKSAAIVQRTIDPNVEAAQSRLREVLGMKVVIEDKQGRGRVTIEYADLDGFDLLLSRLCQDGSDGNDED